MKKPIISILMGSDSDLPIMQQAAEILDEFNIPYELTIISAHRTPERMYEFAKNAHARGIKVIIAGAGGAAHVAGVISGISPLPVIGVPIQTKTLNGIDSLYSIVQMPPGVPTATVAINGAKNAGLLAIQILGTSDKTLQKKMIAYKEKMKQTVIEKAKKLELVGYKKY
jgi:5-(carboxyamino)imidazole ribonucleotide mutase